MAGNMLYQLSGNVRHERLSNIDLNVGNCFGTARRICNRQPVVAFWQVADGEGVVNGGSPNAVAPDVLVWFAPSINSRGDKTITVPSTLGSE